MEKITLRGKPATKKDLIAFIQERGELVFDGFRITRDYPVNFMTNGRDVWKEFEFDPIEFNDN